MKVAYSPSQTALWLECPVKRALRQNGWIPRRMGKRELAGILGTAVTAGLAAYNVARQNQRGTDFTMLADLQVYCSGVARDTARQELARLEGLGCTVGDWDLATAKAIEPRAMRAVNKYIEQDPIPLNWQIVAVEKQYGPEQGYMRPDLIIDDGRGEAPLDYKTKLTLKPEYETREWQRWRDSWQMLHYRWPLQADRYYICPIILEPRFRIGLTSSSEEKLLVFQVHPETAQMWERSAERVWEQMRKEDAGEALPWIAAKHSDEYGPCEFHKACFEDHYDPSLMREDFVNTEDVKRAKSG